MNRSLLPLGVALTFASTAGAANLLLDFGTTPATGQVTVNASAAPVLGGPAALTGSLVYNSVSGTDGGSPTFPASYQFSNGAAATGVSVSITTGTAWTSLTETVADVSRVGISGGRSGVGVFATPASPNNTNLFSDFVSSANANNTNDYLGVSVSGLPVGTYTVYAIANNTYFQTAGAQSRQIRAGTAAIGLTDYSGLTTPTTLAYDYGNIATDTASWTAAQGKYWTSFSISITATNTTLYVGGFKSGDNQGGLFNSLQIVSTSPIPEPSTAALAGGLTVLGLAALRRRRA